MLALFAFPVSLLGVDQPIVGIAGPAINMIYSFVARDAGLFQKHGIDPKLVKRMEAETRLPTYETARTEKKSQEPLGSPVDDEVRERLRSLGYIQ